MRKIIRAYNNYFKFIIRSFKAFYVMFTNKNLKLGENVKIDMATKIYSFGNSITIGNNVHLRSNPKYYQAGMSFPTTLLSDVKNSFITIGDNCRINGAYIHAQKGITIGNNCVIASGVTILDSNGHQLLSSDRTKERDEPKEIIIEDNVWIGLNAVILKGTLIGKNSVVSTSSVVKGTFSSNTLISGNPAVAVKKLDIKN
jgi:acetyltransferase-like isoleucine patch superfamily enzyme